MSSASNEPNDRRRYFRIEDEISLFYKEIAAEQIPESNTFMETYLEGISLTAAIDFITQESRPQLRNIEKNYPDIADYLKNLEQKIDLLAKSVLIQEENLGDKPTQKVSLSASGVAFDSHKALTPGNHVELKMILPPSLVAIITYGKVVYCKPNTEDDLGFPFHIGVDFVRLSDQNREVIIRHVVKKQMQELRSRHESS